MNRRYWDACTFLAWFNREAGNVEKCEGVIKLVKRGDITIVTSALTLAEVVWLKGQPKLDDSTEQTISDFFEQDYIAVRGLDRVIAEQARQLVWQHNVKPKDCIHLATAMSLKMTIFDTFDGGLIKLNGQLGNPPMRIGVPDISHQEEMFEEEIEDE